MNRKITRHSSLSLLELIAAIFFFSFAAAVCIRFFVKSHTLSQDAYNLNMAVTQSSSLAEVFRSQQDLGEALKEYFPNMTFSEESGEYTLYYDENWTPCLANGGFFSLIIQTDQNANLCGSTFTVTNLETTKEIFSLYAEKYTGSGVKTS